MAKTQRNDGDVLRDIHESLELLVNLVSLLVSSEKSITDGARSLKMAGLDNQTIAAVLNTSPQTVRTLTANLRLKLDRRRGHGRFA